MKNKILIIDDETSVLDMLKTYFELMDFIVYTASNGSDGINQISFNPDIILLDVNMPEMDGYEVCKKIRDKVSVPIVFLTANVDESDKIYGLMIGGDDYILKPFSLDELNARVMAHIRRDSRRLSANLNDNNKRVRIDYNARTIYISDNIISFTKTEFEIIELLSKNHGMVFDKETIYERLWGFNKMGDSETITEHVRRIRYKIKKKYIDNNIEEINMIETVWGIGYKWIL